ncbi:MAG: NYN domain-containing protein [Clostridiales bacterium]|nr:NYN domain-containing protein [Clostridiales bacterium]
MTTWHLTRQTATGIVEGCRVLLQSYALQRQLRDSFEDKSLARSAGDQKMDNLYAFIGRNRKTLIVVDCENNDPVKLAAMLSSLNAAQKSAIHKIMLFDSDYTTTAWTTLCQMGIPTDYDTEHVVVGRIYEHKSQVDMTLAANTCREVYLNQVDSVILVSSDSDYWALIQSLPGIHFLGESQKRTANQKRTGKPGTPLLFY